MYQTDEGGQIHAKQLMCNLVQCVEEGSDQTVEHNPALLEVEVGGRHYRLVRIDVYQDIHLSPREAQVARFLVQGLLVKEIATELEIEKTTVATYVKRIYNKLNVSNRAEMVTAIFRRRPIPVE